MEGSLNDWVVVFDLDDTLYKEVDYVRSGVSAVIDCLKELKLHSGVTADEILSSSFDRPLDVVLEKMHLPTDVKESLLWLYRLHPPRISLSKDNADAVSRMQNFAHAVAIVTDGRAITQRLKLAALGLGSITSFISEEIGASKPSTKAFRLVQEMWPRKRYVYLADNVSKDFVGPNSLGWHTIGLKDDGTNIRSLAVGNFEKGYQPDFWIASLAELDTCLSSFTRSSDPAKSKGI
jgi:putative hydrolase of the HAD superfamily